jgi:hypothetical protein
VDDGDRDTERLADPRRKIVDPMSHPSPDVEDLSFGPHLDRRKEGLSKFVSVVACLLAVAVGSAPSLL